VQEHTNFITGSKKVQTRLESEIFCILFACMTAALQEYRRQIQDMKHSEILCLVYLVLLFLPVYLALDGHLTKAHSSIATGLGVQYVLDSL
jgi:hypothetical protein